MSFIDQHDFVCSLIITNNIRKHWTSDERQLMNLLHFLCPYHYQIDFSLNRIHIRDQKEHKVQQLFSHQKIQLLVDIDIQIHSSGMNLSYSLSTSRWSMRGSDSLNEFDSHGDYWCFDMEDIRYHLKALLDEAHFAFECQGLKSTRI
jgi:hypothetical protein